jgi:hypothetical protein
MPVPPAVVGRQQVAQRGQQIVVAAGARLDDRDPRGRVRHEHLEQPVALAADELRTVASQVEDRLGPAGSVVALLGPHGVIVTRELAR